MKWLARWITNKALDSLSLPGVEFSKLPLKEQKEVSSRARDLRTDVVLVQEIDKLIKAAGDNIIRKTSNDVEIAWNRGAIHGLESLKNRLQYLASFSKTRREG